MADQLPPPLAIFKKEAPEAFAAFFKLSDALNASKGIDNKTRQLLTVGIKAVQGDTIGAVIHTGMAKQAGATREEVKDVILNSLTVSGINGVIACLGPALEAYDKK